MSYFMSLVFGLISLFISSSVFAQLPSTTPSAPIGQSVNTNQDVLATNALLETAILHLRARRPTEVVQSANQIIQHFENKYKDSSTDHVRFSTDEQLRILFYLLDAANKKKNATVYSPNWATAHFIKAYALVEMRQYGEAKSSLEAALVLDPRNPQYLNELANTLAGLKDYSSALDFFKSAQQNAAEFTHPTRKNPETARSLRGQGFALIELKRIDEAEAAYRDSLKFEPNNPLAINQLKLIQKVKTTSASISPSNEVLSNLGAMPQNFEQAWQAAESLSALTVVQAHVQKVYFEEAHLSFVDQFRKQCVTATFPGPLSTKAVLAIDIQGRITQAWTDQQGFVADCLKEKIAGARTTIPPTAPLLLCMRLDTPASNQLTQSACGAITLRRVCESQGNTEKCSVFTK